MAAYILPLFTTFYEFNFVMSYFCWGGGTLNVTYIFDPCWHGVLHFEGLEVAKLQHSPMAFEFHTRRY